MCSGSVDYFSSKSLRTDLRGKTVRGGVLTVLAQAALGLITVLTVPVFTRLLEPSDFGLVAMVTVFTGLAVMFADAGLAMATVQREGITQQQVSNLFWIAAALGSLVAVLVCASSPLIAWLYGEPRLIPITIAMSAAPFFGGLTVQHQALLRRTMRFGHLAAIQVSSSVMAHALAIAMAWKFRSYWALVILPVSMSALRMIGTWAACRWLPSLPRRNSGVRAMVGFGANLTGFNFVNYFARSGDNMLIGWSWGETALGFYERAYKLMMMPLQQINAPLAGVLVPALSRLIDEPQRYKAAYFRAVAVFQVVSCPLMMFLVVTAEPVVDIVFGPGYEHAAPILRWLAVAGLVQPLTNSLGWLYISQGRSRELLRWGFLGGSLTVLSFMVGLPDGPLGVARAYAGMICVIIVPLAIWFAGAAGPVGRGDLAKSCVAAILMAAPTAVASSVVIHFVELHSVLVELFWAALASVIATAPLVFCTRFGRSLVGEFRNFFRILLSRMR